MSDKKTFQVYPKICKICNKYAEYVSQNLICTGRICTGSHFKSLMCNHDSDPSHGPSHGQESTEQDRGFKFRVRSSSCHSSQLEGRLRENFSIRVRLGVRFKIRAGQRCHFRPQVVVVVGGVHSRIPVGPANGN